MLRSLRFKPCLVRLATVGHSQAARLSPAGGAQSTSNDCSGSRQQSRVSQQEDDSACTVQPGRMADTKTS